MLSVFGLSFFAVYIVLKWRYVLPTVYGSDDVNWSVWPYSLSAGTIAAAQLVFDFPAVSSSVVYTQLFLAVYAVASPKSETWKCCFVSLLLSSLHTFKNGTITETVVAAVLLLAVLKYYHHTRKMMPN